ncbi:MAG: hypothetical protein ACRDBI_08370 [Shewanella sp.]
MLFRCAVVWLFALAILLGAPAKGIALEHTHGPKLLASPSHSVSLLPASESPLNSLRPHVDTYELQPPQPSNVVAIYAVSEEAHSYAANDPLGSLCRGMPIGQAPPSIC